MPQVRLINGINPLDHQGLVRKISWHYSRPIPAMREDFEQIGYIGLMKACERFDPARNHKFSTYAYPIIRGEISHWIRDHLSLVRIPRPLLKQGVTYHGCPIEPYHATEKIDSDLSDLLYELEKLPRREKFVIKMSFFNDLTTVEIAKNLGLSTKTVKRCKANAIATLRSKFDFNKP